MRVAFVGFGLIGGSIARALRSAPGRTWHVTAWSPSGGGPEQALADGIIDVAAASPEDALRGADLVVLAAPASDCLIWLDDFAGRLAPALTPGAIVTDVASTKGRLVDRAQSRGVRYVGGHPMAGREASGYGSATADLFAGRPWILVPASTSTPADLAVVTDLARACAARPMVMEAAAHDDAVAAISHLPLIVAAALVEAVAGTEASPRPDWPEVAGLAASGWRDTTRLARGDPSMGAAIAVTNGPAIAARLRDLRAVLDDWLADLEAVDGPDEADVFARLQAAQERLDGDAHG